MAALSSEKFEVLLKMCPDFHGCKSHMAAFVLIRGELVKLQGFSGFEKKKSRLLTCFISSQRSWIQQVVHVRGIRLWQWELAVHAAAAGFATVG